MNYKFEESIQKIKNFMREKNDYVTLKIVKVQKVHLMYLKKLDEKMIERISREIYIDVNAIEDVYYTCNLGILSLFFQDLQLYILMD